MDYNIGGSIMGSPYSGKLPMAAEGSKKSWVSSITAEYRRFRAQKPPPTPRGM